MIGTNFTDIFARDWVEVFERHVSMLLADLSALWPDGKLLVDLVDVGGHESTGDRRELATSILLGLTDLFESRLVKVLWDLAHKGSSALVFWLGLLLLGINVFVFFLPRHFVGRC